MKRAAVLILWLTACGDDAPRDAGMLGDAEEDAPSSVEIASPAAAMAPDPPDFSGCPDGWSSTEGRCEAQPARDCPRGTMQLPDEVECEAIGPPCPDGPYAEDVPSGRPIVYVLEGGGGDGTRDAPFGTLAEALDAAEPGALVVLGRGTYHEAPIIERSIDILGACATATVIEPPIRAGLLVRGDVDIGMRRLTVRQPVGIALNVREGARVVVSEVEIESVDFPLIVEDSRLRAEHTAVRGAEQPTLTSSSTEIEASAFYGSGPGLRAGSLTMHRIRIVGLLDGFSRGVANNGGEAHLDEVSIRSDKAFSVTARGELTVDVASMEGDTLLLATEGSTASFSHVVFRGSGEELGGVSLEGGAVVLSDVDIVLDAQLAAPALDIHDGASLELERVRLTGRSETQVVASNGATIRGTDLTIDGPRVGSGFGLSALGESTISLERVLVENSGFGGVLAQGSTIELTDLVVRDAGLANPAGWGILAWQGGTVSLERASIEGCRGVGLLAVDPGSELTGSDVRIVDPRPSIAGDYGRGVEASAGASIALSRTVIETSHEHGVLCAGASIALTDARIVDAQARGCADTTCADRPYGVGVSAYDGVVTLERFEVRRAALCGLHIGDGGSIVASDGLVAESAVGLCASESNALTDPSRSVRYEGNGTTVSSLRLPVPEPFTPDS